MKDVDSRLIRGWGIIGEGRTPQNLCLHNGKVADGREIHSDQAINPWINGARRSIVFLFNWVHHCRYLVTIIMSSSSFKCNFNECRKSFCRAFNSTFACIGRKASDEVIVEFVITKKCLPALLYASEALPFNSNDFKSLDYVIGSRHLERFLNNQS